MAAVGSATTSGQTPVSGRGTFTPVWWVTLAWLAMVIATPWTAHRGRLGLDLAATRILATILFALAAVSVQVANDRLPMMIRAAGVLVATTAGLLIVLTAPSGLGEVPIYLAATRLPFAFPVPVARGVAAVSTLATSLAVGFVSHSLAGLLAGLGVPFLAQRALDRRALLEERDLARALLVEVEAGRAAETQAAALRERGRIAREMHDVLAHSLAGLSLQLQAARAVAHKEGAGIAVLGPLDRAAALAREGLAEARSAVGTLSDPSLRGIAELHQLIDSYPSASLVTSGTAGVLAPEAGHAVYRAVQESLTNAARYAPGSAVRISLAWQPGSLTATVDDDGAAAGHLPLVGVGTGMGLVGMRERVHAAGGRVEVGPQQQGWRVMIVVPADEASA